MLFTAVGFLSLLRFLVAVIVHTAALRTITAIRFRHIVPDFKLLMPKEDLLLT